MRVTTKLGPRPDFFPDYDHAPELKKYRELLTSDPAEARSYLREHDVIIPRIAGQISSAIADLGRRIEKAEGEELEKLRLEKIALSEIILY